MTPEEIEAEFPNLRLGDLFRLSVFVADNMHGPVPTSMRTFMKATGSSHKRMLRILDAVEKSAEELIVFRVVLNPDGTHSDRVVQSYAEAVRLDKQRDDGVEGAMGTKRVPGAVTPYAKLWYFYGFIVGELYRRVVETATPSAMEHELRKALATLKLDELTDAPFQDDRNPLPPRNQS